MKPEIERALGQYLAVRIRSSGEVIAYLTRRGVPEDEIQQLVKRFQELDFIDDAEFIRQVIQSYLKKGKGPLFIRQKLLSLHIPRSEVEPALSKVTNEQWSRAMEKRVKKMENYPREKLIFRLRTSGFLGSQASRFIDVWVTKE